MPPNQVAPAPVEEPSGGDGGAVVTVAAAAAADVPVPSELFSAEGIPAPLQVETTTDADGNSVAVAIDMTNAASPEPPSEPFDGNTAAAASGIVAPAAVGDGVEGPVAGFTAVAAAAPDTADGIAGAGPAFNNKVAPADADAEGERGMAMPSRADMLANDTVIHVGDDAFAADDDAAPAAAARKRSSNHDTVINVGADVDVDVDGGQTWDQAIVPAETALALQDDGEEEETMIAAEIEYVPKAAATQHLQKAVQALKSMRSKTVDAVAGIQSQYVGIEEQTKDQVSAYVASLKTTTAAREKVLTGALKTYAEKLKLLAEQNTGMRSELAVVAPKIASLETEKATIEESEKEARSEIEKLAAEREALEKELADAKAQVAAAGSGSFAPGVGGSAGGGAGDAAGATGAAASSAASSAGSTAGSAAAAAAAGGAVVAGAAVARKTSKADGEEDQAEEGEEPKTTEEIAAAKAQAAAAEAAAEKVAAEIDEHKEDIAELEAMEAESPEEAEAQEEEIREKRATVSNLEVQLAEHLDTAEVAAAAVVAVGAVDGEEKKEKENSDGDLDSLASDKEDGDSDADPDPDPDADPNDDDADADLGSTADLTGSLEAKQAMEDEIERLKTEVDALKVANIGKVSDAETSELQLQIRTLQAEMAAQKAEIDAAKSEKKELQEASMRRMSDSSGQEMAKLLAKIDTLEEEKSENQHAGIQKVAELEQLNEEKGKVEAQLKAAEEQRAAKDEAYTASRKKISSLEQKLLVAKTQAKSSSGAGGAGSKEQAEQIKKLQRNINKMEKENNKLQREVDASATKATGKPAITGAEKMKMDKAMAKFEKDAAKYKEGYEKTKGELKSVTTEKGELEKTAKKLEFELAAAKKSMGASADLAVNLKSAEDQVTLLTKEAKSSKKAVEEAGLALNEERKLRKKYYNQIEDMKGKIRVYCRARPISGSELERGNVNCIDSPDEYSIAITNEHGAGGKKQIEDFTFDRVYTAKNSQADVYEDTHALIQSAVDGYNVCIFAYGQTGSGKTYTMIGAPEEEKWGLAPRAFTDIFRVLGELGPTWEYKVHINMVEIYCDKLKDLFIDPKHASDAHDLKIRKRKNGQVYVEGITEKEVFSAENLNDVFTEASRNRVVKKTNMNAESSRSHLIISIFIEAKDKIGGKVNSGKLSLIDLAGSERFGKTGATGQAAIEAQSINKSLSALAEVINALSTLKEHVPFRNSILTQLMQDSLGGNAKTLMFVNISPVDYNAPETVNALKYAERAKKITNKAKVNVDSTQVAKLKAIIKAYEEGTYDAAKFGMETEDLDVDEDFAGDATGEESAL